MDEYRGIFDAAQHKPVMPEDIERDFPKLSWVICGGESGPNARPMHPDWARSLRDQCQVENVPFFLKQMQVNGKLVKMPELDGRVWDEFPEEVKL
jgi:protein gp37